MKTFKRASAKTNLLDSFVSCTNPPRRNFDTYREYDDKIRRCNDDERFRRISRAISVGSSPYNLSAIDDFEELYRRCRDNLPNEEEGVFRRYYSKLQLVAKKYGVRLSRLHRTIFGNICDYDFYSLKQDLYYYNLMFITKTRIPFQKAMTNKYIPSQQKVIGLFQEHLTTLGIYIMQLLTCNKISQFLLATASCVRSLFGSNFTKFFYSVEDFNDFIIHFFFGGPLPEDGSIIENFLNMCKNIRDGWSRIQDNHIYQRFYKLLVFFANSSLAISLGLTDSLKYFVPISKKVQQHESGSIIGHLASVLLDFFNGAYQYFVNGNDMAFVHTSETYVSWIQECILLRSQEYLVRDCLPEECCGDEITLDSYFIRLEKVIEQGNEILMCTKKSGKSSDVTLITRYLREMNDLHVKQIVHHKYGSTRDMPFSILLFGEPGVGKSHLTKILLEYYHKRYHPDIEFNDNLVYTRSQTKHWDGAKSFQKYLILDDLACEKAKQNSQLPEKMSDLISAINTVPFVTPQAEAEVKGKIFANHEFVIGTTNVKNLAVEHYFANAGALLRRFPYVTTVSPKKSYVDKQGNFDITLCPPDNLLDVFDLVVEQVEIIPSTLLPRDDGLKIPEYNARYSQILRTSSIKVFLDFIGQKMDIHHSKQKLYKRLDYTSLINPCTICKNMICSCSKPEEEVTDSGEDIECILGDITAEADVMTSNIGLTLGGAVAFSGLCWTIWTTSTSISSISKDFNEMSSNLCNTSNYIKDKINDFSYDVNEEVSRIRRIGDRVEKIFFFSNYPVIKYFKAIIMILSGVALAKFTHSIYSKWSRLDVGHEEGDRITSDNNFSLFTKEKENPSVYKVNYDYELNALRAPSKQCTTVTKEQMVDICERQIVKFMCRTPNNAKSTGGEFHKFKGVAVAGNNYIVPHHSIPLEGSSFYIVYKKGAYNSNTHIWTNVSYRRIKGFDLGIVCVPGTPLNKDIRSYLLQEYFPKNRKLDTIVNGMNLIATTLDVTHTRKNTFIPQYNVFEVPSLGYDRSMQGDCGYPIICKYANGFGIIGFHVAGSATANKGWAHCPTRHDIDSVIKDIQKDYDMSLTISFPEADLMCHKYELTLDPNLHYKNMCNFIEKGAFIVLGEIKGIPYGKPKCDVKPAFLQDEMEQIFGSCGYFKPDFTIGFKNGIWQDPFQNDINLIGHTKVVVSEEELHLAATSYLERIFRDLKNTPLFDEFKMTPLTDYQAVNGVPGVRFIDSIKFSAGGGFDMFTKKKEYCDPCPTKQNPDGKMFKKEVLDHIKVLENELMNGRLISPIYVSHLKSEARVEKPYTEEELKSLSLPPNPNGSSDPTKYKVKAPRVFSGTPAAFSHLVRKYFLPFTKIMQDNSFTFECAVGVNAECGDWNEFHKYLTIFGHNRLIGGDYSKFDKGVTSLIVLKVFWIIEKVCEFLKADRIMLKFIRLLGIVTAYPQVFTRYTLIRLLASNPSGHPLTVIVNCIINSLYVRIATMRQGFDVDKFNDNVNLLTYGDDNIMGINPNWNLTFDKLRQGLKSMGIEYTLPDKTIKDVDYMDIKDIDFLKRKFRFCEYHGVYVAPLALSSIQRSLCWMSETDIAPLDHCLIVLGDVQRHLYSHGREVFDDFIGKLKRVVALKGLEYEFKSFDYWMNYYKPRYEERNLDYEAYVARRG